MTSNIEDIEKNGWAAVPIDAAKIFDGKPFLHEPEYVPLDDIVYPSDDPVVADVLQYAKEHLPEPTLNHSLRIFYWGMVILKQQLPERSARLSAATYAIACLLHDIGTTDKSASSTRMSFEFQGAFIALDLLRGRRSSAHSQDGGRLDQAEAVAEAIARHSQVGPGRLGSVTLLGQALQLSTVYDNVGAYAGVPGFAALVHPRTVDEVVARFPRLGWSSCMMAAMGREIELKPWCHMTSLQGFVEAVRMNELLNKYE